MKKIIIYQTIVIFLVCFTFCSNRYTSSTTDEPEIKPERILYLPPSYPQEALKQGIEGMVIAKIHIDLRGNVVAVEIIESPDATFDQAFRAAAKQWKYSPSSLHRMNTIITVVHHFTIPRRES